MTGITFCYWDCKTKIDLIIIIFWQTFTTTIGSIAFLRMLTLIKLYRHHNKRMSTLLLVDILVLLWSITLSVANFYSIGAFIFNLEGEMDDTEMIDHSHVYAGVQSFPGFFVQTLFITVCYKFCSNILKQEDISLFSKYCTPFKKILFIYCIIRAEFRLVIVFLIAFSSNQNVGYYSTIQFIGSIADAGIINIFLVGCERLFMNRLDSSHFGQLKLEYGTMFLCSLCRIIINIVYMIVGPNSEVNNICFGYFNIKYTLLYNVAGYFLMYFVPIAIILSIYQYNQNQTNESLLPPTESIIQEQRNRVEIREQQEI